MFLSIPFQYCQLKTRKENFVKLLERMQHYQSVHLNALKQRRYVRLAASHTNPDDECDEQEDPDIANRLDSARPLDTADLDRVRSAQTIDDFLDCYHHFHLHYGPDLIPMKHHEAKLLHQATTAANPDDADDDPALHFNKYASRKDRFHHCKQAGLWSLANKFGLTCEQLGENLLADYQLHDIDQCAIEPNMLAMDFVREPYFQNVEQVLGAVKYMVAVQLAKDPVVRGCVREMYMQNACLNVRPVLPRGLKEIDETHPCYPFKYLAMKPCSKLRGDDFYKLDQAEREGLITIKFETGKIKTYATVSSQRSVIAK
jgi:transcription elongation factor SPT6